MISETFIYPERDTWGEGPWQHEPDRIEWEYAGLVCLMVRHPNFGSWCGCVGVGPGHPLYGRPASEADHCVDAARNIGYAAPCDEGGLICHRKRPGLPDEIWWFGFDCAHIHDLSPGFAARERKLMPPELQRTRPEWMREVYRTQAVVQQWVNDLATQIKKAASLRPSE